MTSVFKSSPSRNLLMMRKSSVIIVLIAALASPAIGWSQLVSGRLISSVSVFEKIDSVRNDGARFSVFKNTRVRGFQSIMLDIGQGDFNLHVHAQGAATLQQPVDDLPDYRLYYLYGRWRNIGDVADLSLGRIPYFVGVGVGTMDGLLTTIRMSENKLRFTLYGGSNVANDISIEKYGPLKNNFTFGGQFLTTAIERMRLGISYMNRQRERGGYIAIRPDSLGNGMQVVVEPPLAKEQYISGDAAYEVSDVKVYGRYDFNLNSEKTQRAQLGVRYVATDDVTVTGEFIHRAPRVLFNSFFALFNTSSVNEVEAGVDYRLMPEIRAFARTAFVKYTDDNSFRYTLGLAHNYYSISYRGNAGYAGELNAISVQGAYPLFENTLTPTAGVTVSWYKQNENAKSENATAAVLGVILRPARCVSLHVQGQWLQNKVLKNDLRMYAKLNYWFTERLNIFD